MYQNFENTHDETVNAKNNARLVSLDLVNLFPNVYPKDSLELVKIL